MEIRAVIITQLTNRNGLGVDLTQDELHDLGIEIEGILERSFDMNPWATEAQNEVLLTNTEIEVELKAEPKEK